MTLKTSARRIQVNAGDRYCLLTIIQEEDPIILHGRPFRRVLCRCDCGSDKTVFLKDIRSSAVKSCGCLHDTLPIKHGHATNGERSLSYRSWMNIRRRCLNKNAHEYSKYGGRGIRICDRWKEFDAFLDDMGERPSLLHSIDRIDPDGDYTPENCRWANPKEQGRNRRNNRMLTHNGETLCLSEWAERVGFSVQALRSRLDVCGYTVEEALTLPLGEKRHG